MSVYIGDVQTFAGVIADKPQVLKIGEEVMEVFSAWEDYKYAPEFRKEALIAEIADVIQAACNLLAAIGVDDMRQPMQECYVRNKERGREYSSSDDMDSAVYVQKCPNESCRQYADQGEHAELPDCESDSREKLEADVRKCFDPPEQQMIIRWLDRQAAITHSIDAWNIKRLEEERESLQDQVDELQEQNENQRAIIKDLQQERVTVEQLNIGLVNKSKELREENEVLKARIESLRSKLSKMLDAASAIQHIGDLP